MSYCGRKGTEEEYFCFQIYCDLYFKSKHFEATQKYFKFIHQNIKKKSSEKLFGWYDLNPSEFQISIFHSVLG